MHFRKEWESACQKSVQNLRGLRDWGFESIAVLGNGKCILLPSLYGLHLSCTLSISNEKYKPQRGGDGDVLRKRWIFSMGSLIYNKYTRVWGMTVQIRSPKHECDQFEPPRPRPGYICITNRTNPTFSQKVTVPTPLGLAHFR